MMIGLRRAFDRLREPVIVVLYAQTGARIDRERKG